MNLHHSLAAFALLGTSIVWASPAERAPLDEVAAKGTTSNVQFVRGTFSVDYTDTNVGGPTYNRNLSGCGGLSGVGSAVAYHTQEFTVAGAGSFSIDSAQDYDGFLALYADAFNPADATQNCVDSNDDGPGGIGTSLITGAALNAGTTYIVVTTGFGNADVGTFTNTISGPTAITLGGGGGGATVDVTKTAPDGVATGGAFSYQIDVVNNNPDAVLVTLTDVLPMGMTYVGDSCGGSVTAGTWTTDLNIAAGGAASCDLQVSIGATCLAITNEVSASVDGGGVTTSVTSNASEQVADGGFEGGSPNASWTEASANFGSPLCTAGACGVGSGTGPRTGTWWLWFGGFGGGVETGSVEQTVSLPMGADFVEFWLETPVCNNGASDFARLLIDGTEVWRVDATAASCGVVGYQPVVVDISAFADGGTHLLRFESQTIGGAGASNFFIDDVSISQVTCTVAGIPLGAAMPIPTLQFWGLALLAGLMGLFVALRRRAGQAI